MTAGDWYDTVPASTVGMVAGASLIPNLERMLNGVEVRVTGDPEIGQEDEQRFVVSNIAGVTVGIDRHGIFSTIEVQTTTGHGYRLLDNGDVEAVDDDRWIGKHHLRFASVLGFSGRVASGCGHDGWQANCPECERHEQLARKAMGDR